MTDVRTLNVPDMSCQHCIDAITNEVSNVEGVATVAIDLAAKTVAVAGGDLASIIAAIDEAGFDVA